MWPLYVPPPLVEITREQLHSHYITAVITKLVFRIRQFRSFVVQHLEGSVTHLPRTLRHSRGFLALPFCVTYPSLGVYDSTLRLAG